jgi:molecular chaperone GrpE
MPKKKREEGDIEVEGGEVSSPDREVESEEASRKDLERKIDELSSQLDDTRAELEETKDKFLRSLADFDNYRKRIAREREQLTRCATEDLIRHLLEVVDNLERALSSASEDRDFEGLHRGVELIYQHIKEILDKQGLCPISCLGEAFDPNYHEAVMTMEAEGEESDRVIEEIQRGYTLDGRVIRPSKVVVSK